MNTYRVPIQKLFEILGIDNIAHDAPTTVPHRIRIDSPQGFVDVRAFVKKRHQIAEYVFDHTTLTCSTEHLVFSNNKARKIKTCSVVDTIDGQVTVQGVIDKGIADVYDIALDLPHQYVTPNGIIHHNTSLSKILFNELGVDDGDLMIINASRENNVDTMRNKIEGFASSMPFAGEFKYILLDEADFLGVAAQSVLRNMMETYANTCRFVLTANYPNKIIPAIHSRCQGFHITSLDQTEFTVRVATILLTENVEFDPSDLDVYVKATYPDLRKCIGMVQQNVVNGKLQQPSSGESGESDWVLEYVALFQLGKVSEARKMIVEKARPEEYEGVFRKLYENLDWFGDDVVSQGKALLCIRDGLVHHAVVADPEINLSATLLELQYIARKQ